MYFLKINIYVNMNLLNLVKNLLNTRKNINKKEEVKNICGVIGTIETRKQTHTSIERAIKYGCEKILLYGKIGDMSYYDSYVKPHVDNNKVILKGFSENKQDMYDSIEKVFHSSLAEVACLVKDECFLTGTEFFGNEETEHEVSKLSNEEILELWKVQLSI